MASEMEYYSFYFPLKPMFSSPSSTKVIIIIASGMEPVTRHYSKVKSHPDGQLLGDKNEAEICPEMLKSFPFHL